MDDYVAGLPAGLDSYPEVIVKASVLREFTRELAGSDLAGKLPEAVGELITSPPPVSAWVPEVHAVTLFVGVRYLLMESDASFLEWAYKHNTRLLRGPLYAILFKLVSPERVLRGASERWGHFHRGIELGAPKLAKGSATLTMTCPPKLMPRFLAAAYGTGFRAALEAAGASSVTLELLQSNATSFQFQGTWS